MSFIIILMNYDDLVFQRDKYIKELQELTRKMRGCKQLEKKVKFNPKIKNINNQSDISLSRLIQKEERDDTSWYRYPHSSVRSEVGVADLECIFKKNRWKCRRRSRSG